MNTQTKARAPRAAILTRDTAPPAAPQNVSEVLALAGELRNSVADLRQRVESREQAGYDDTQIRADLSEQTQAIASMQTELARANRPTAPAITAEAQRSERLGAFAHWLRTGDPAKLVELGAWKPEMAQRATQGLAGNNPQGGYVVLDEFDTAIDRISRIFSNVRAYARVHRSGATTVKKVTNKSGTTAYWSSETGTKTETDALDFAINEITAHEANAIPVYSRVLLNDAFFDINGEILRDLGEAFGKLEGAAFVNGDGAGKPQGFMAIDKAAQTGVTEVAYGKLGYVKTGQAAAWGASQTEINSFRSVQVALKTEYLARAAYYGNRVSLGEIMLFKDADNRPIWQPSMQAGVPSQLCGYDYRVIEEMASMAANTYPITFGDMESYYTVLDVAGIEVLLNPFRTTGFTRFEAWKRTGGKVMKSEAMKAIKVSA